MREESILIKFSKNQYDLLLNYQAIFEEVFERRIPLEDLVKESIFHDYTAKTNDLRKRKEV